MRPPDPEAVRRLVREAVERSLGPEPAAPSAPPARVVSRKRVAVGSDHGGFELKQVLARVIRDELKWEVVDVGTHSTDAVDYPDFAAAVAREVAAGRVQFGVVVDSAGIGSTMAANKIAGVRCALCHDDTTVLNAREHNDANMLALGARIVNRGSASRMVRLFLTTSFAGGRHERRVAKIMALDASATAVPGSR